MLMEHHGKITAVFKAPTLPHQLKFIPDWGTLKARKITSSDIANPQSKPALVTSEELEKRIKPSQLYFPHHAE
jgi:hypothetical protein